MGVNSALVTFANIIFVHFFDKIGKAVHGTAPHGQPIEPVKVVRREGYTHVSSWLAQNSEACMKVDMAVFRSGNKVLFMPPVPCSRATLTELAGDATEVFLGFPNMWHHMSTDWYLEVFPGAKLIGCADAGLRHRPRLDITPFASLPAGTFPGLHGVPLGGNILCEHAVVFEPANLLLVCDMLQTAPIMTRGRAFQPALGRLIERATGHTPGAGCAHKYSSGYVSDKRALAASWAQLFQDFPALREPSATLFCCHGGPASDSASAVVLRTLKQYGATP